MANVAHSSLTGTDLHESKGIASATANTFYVADGLGSGTFKAPSDVLSFAGMIADFATPVAPSGWLELDGSTISRVGTANANVALFNAIAIHQSGTRSHLSKQITGLADTSNMKVGYFVGGPGIPTLTTIVSVDDTTKITLSAFPINDGTAVYDVSPWDMGDGSTNFVLPRLNGNGKYRRSRTSTLPMGTVQGDQLKSHTHTVNSNSGHTAGQSVDHTHAVGTLAMDSQGGHTHSYGLASSNATGTGSGTSFFNVSTPTNTDSQGAHTHTISGSTDGVSTGHNHNVTIDATAAGTPDETRPVSIVVMTCIKL